MFDRKFSSEFVLSRFRGREASKGILLKVENRIDCFREDSVDLNEDIGEEMIEALDFSSFGGS